MRKIFVGLLAVSLLLAGCTGTAEISTMPEDIVESYLDASNNDDIDTCLSLLSDDVVFYQDPPGIGWKGKLNSRLCRKSTCYGVIEILLRVL